jgi:hypothetical protein
MPAPDFSPNFFKALRLSGFDPNSDEFGEFVKHIVAKDIFNRLIIMRFIVIANVIRFYIIQGILFYSDIIAVIQIGLDDMRG